MPSVLMLEQLGISFVVSPNFCERDLIEILEKNSGLLASPSNKFVFPTNL